MSGECCGGCLYYHVDTESLIITGQRNHLCRRFPPAGFPIIQQGMNGQPMQSIMYRQAEVKPDGWCGEWRGLPHSIPVDVVSAAEVTYSVPNLSEDY